MFLKIRCNKMTPFGCCPGYGLLQSFAPCHSPRIICCNDILQVYTPPPPTLCALTSITLPIHYMVLGPNSLPEGDSYFNIVGHRGKVCLATLLRERLHCADGHEYMQSSLSEMHNRPTLTTCDPSY